MPAAKPESASYCGPWSWRRCLRSVRHGGSSQRLHRKHLCQSGDVPSQRPRTRQGQMPFGIQSCPTTRHVNLPTDCPSGPTARTPAWRGSRGSAETTVRLDRSIAMTSTFRFWASGEAGQPSPPPGDAPATAAIELKHHVEHCQLNQRHIARPSAANRWLTDAMEMEHGLRRKRAGRCSLDAPG
jgi:hypothetical protein